VNDLKNGAGRFLWCDGSEYEGHFRNDELDGVG